MRWKKSTLILGLFMISTAAYANNVMIPLDDTNSNELKTLLSQSHYKTPPSSILFKATKTQKLSLSNLALASHLVKSGGMLGIEGPIKPTGQAALLSDLNHNTIWLRNTNPEWYTQTARYAHSIYLSELTPDQARAFGDGLTGKDIELKQNLTAEGQGVYPLAKDINYTGTTYNELKLTLPVDADTSPKAVESVAYNIERTQKHFSLTLSASKNNPITPNQLAKLHKSVMKSFKTAYLWNTQASGFRRRHAPEYPLSPAVSYYISANTPREALQWDPVTVQHLSSSSITSNIQ